MLGGRGCYERQEEVITSVSIESRLVVNLVEEVVTSVSVEPRLVVNLVIEVFT